MTTLAMTFVDGETREWEAMWQRLEELHGDMFCQCPITGELWQYMGSVEREVDGGDVTVWIHQFRHRALPPKGTVSIETVGERARTEIAASPGWKPEVSRPC